MGLRAWGIGHRAWGMGRKAIKVGSIKAKGMGFRARVIILP